MKESYALTQQDFDTLLSLFSADREEAGHRYERLREGLIRFFQFRGCNDPLALADETFNRVASKIAAYDGSANVQPSAYVYGFARKILLEHLRGLRNRETQLDASHSECAVGQSGFDADSEADLASLQKCLNELPAEDRALVLEYFSRDRGEKIELRRQMAARLGASSQVLQTRIFRIKTVLRKCMHRCGREKP